MDICKSTQPSLHLVHLIHTGQHVSAAATTRQQERSPVIYQCSMGTH